MTALEVELATEQPCEWFSRDNSTLSCSFLPNDVHMDSNFAWLMCSLISAMAWAIYISYYNSRVTGYIVTRLLTRFYVTKGYLSVGSFTVCVLSGKIMFRDIVYITHDYTVRVQDGWLIFRWWRSYVPKDVSEDLSHSDTRLSVMLNGFELHVYNRCRIYSSLERLFGFEPTIIPPDELDDKGDEDETDDPGGQHKASLGKSWRDLIPVIKTDVSSGRVVFGNRLVPTTLSINVEEAHFVYSTKPAASRLDHFMHFVKCKAENFKVILAPSPKYTGMADDPPRYMGAGFVVLSSNNIELYHYMDEPGLVPEEPEMLQLANGDIVESAPPIWGIDIKCGKGTDFSYGPWADRQREHLFKFFFPPDYQPLKVTPAPRPGEKRLVQSFDVRLSTLYEATIDILFTKNKETNAVHINVGPGSYLEITMPWVVSPNGYTTKITGQLLHLEATTSLTFRSLVESETLEFTVRSHYPIQWNDHQDWMLNLTGCKATGWFIFAHKEFFQDLVNEWSSKSRPDLLYFIPYTWRISVLLKEFEVLTLGNEYNWIDCSSQNQENAHLAFCGELFDFSFDLPFVDFLPNSLLLKFWVQGESMDLSLYLNEVYTSRTILLAIDQNAKLLQRDGTILHPRPQENAKKWRNICKRSNGWLDCWSVPIVALSINYTYHPMPPFGPPPQADITTPEKEEILLSPMRMQRTRKSPAIHWTQDGNFKFDPCTLKPDRVSLELEIGPSVMLVYGSWIRCLVNLKENIFGEDQSFTDMNTNPLSSSQPPTTQNATDASDDSSISKKNFDPREYRPLDVIVSITMHDIQAHLMKNCSESDPPCPVILLERFGFEMRKGYKETQLQLLLSPGILISSDNIPMRVGRDKHLHQGHLMLSGFQIRGHAMFSDTGRSLDQETLEYAWMLEIQLGRLTGKMTSPQLHHLITGLETLVLLTLDPENKLQPPRLPQECHHGLPPKECTESNPDRSYRCPSGDEIKYRMTRVTIDAVDFYLVESSTAINLLASPIRVATCNLHGNHVKCGVTAVLPFLRLRQYISAGSSFAHSLGNTGGSNSNTNTTGSGRSQHRGPSSANGSELWLEVGSVSMGPLILEAAVSLCDSDKSLHLVQHKYLKTHDEKYKRLWFLWPSDSKFLTTGKCGCIGGCQFFGRNRNGQRFFKPGRQDINDGINVAAFRINGPGKDPGFGQSILHESQLIFHTPPYDSHQVSIHESPIWSAFEKPGSTNLKPVLTGESGGGGGSPVVLSRVAESDSCGRINTATPSPSECRSAVSRRFSYTSSNIIKPSLLVHSACRDVPYARLLDSSPTNALPPKLDSDSKLTATRSILSVPESEMRDGPKSSVSDSGLAVDYFNRPLQTGSDSVEILFPSKENKSTNLCGSESSLVYEEAITRAPSDEVSLFHRTTSLTSENQSETFFSAEEELSAGQMSNRQEFDASSRSCTLRHSLPLSSKENLAKKHYGSDMNIMLGKSLPVTSSNTMELNTRLYTHRSDHEIHTPEHRSLAESREQSGGLTEDETLVMDSLPMPRKLHHKSSASRFVASSLNGLQDIDKNSMQDTLLLDSSDSHSVSSTSFLSAVSSQEDLALINLHMQVNKPIVDSPLLMTTYIHHLSQLRCNNWSQCSLPAGSDAFTVPLFQPVNDDKLVFVGSKYLPRFEMMSEGFTGLKMVSRGREKDGSPIPPTSSSRTPTHPYMWDVAQQELVYEEERAETECEEELLSQRIESGTRTTIIIKMNGDVDIMVSPLALESLQRIIDALTPTLSNLHPLSVLNHLHMSCISRVEAANVLKQDQYLSQLQGGGSKRSTVERKKGIAAAPPTSEHEPSSILEQYIVTQVQGTVVLPKINICVLQASIVEEVISFSALDNIRDLTCISLLALSFDGITTRFHYSKQAREIVQTFHRPTIVPGGHKKGVFSKAAGKAFLLGLTSSTVTKDITRPEPVYIETSEKQQEETVITLNINQSHAQLRRLRNECSILKDAVITAIPSHCSKVMFTTCAKAPSAAKPTSEQSTDASNGFQDCFPMEEDTTLVSLSEEKMGFIMMEFGLEGVSLKVVKRSKFEKDDDENVKSVEECEKSPANQNTDSVRSKEDAEANNPSENKTASSQSEPVTSTPIGGAKHTNSMDAGNDATCSETMNSQVAVSKNMDENASSCVVDVRTVWFNFAAPPRTPITRKIDYTRLDWNLLSTASPAINAWMNPSNRFAIRTVHMLRCRYRRCTAVVTCLMAEALDVQSMHMLPKSRYGRTTPLAKALQEDPSCQLCIILQRYVLQSDIKQVEANLKDPELPHLSTLRQGVIVLSRQWKNILYTPLLLEHNFKSKHHAAKRMNYTFAVPDPEEENVLTDGECSGEEVEPEVTDECAMLLHPSTLLSKPSCQAKYAGLSGNKSDPSGGDGPTIAVQSPSRAHLPPNTDVLNIDSLFGSPTSIIQQSHGTSLKKKKTLLPSQPASSTRASVVFPLLSNTNPFLSRQRQGERVSGYSALKEDLPHVGSNPSLHSVVNIAVDSQHSITSLDNHGPFSPLTSGASGKGDGGEDLYTWMAKQQDFMQGSSPEPNKKDSLQHRTAKDQNVQEPVPATVIPEYTLLAAGGYSLYPMHDSLRLLDAHLIFEPLLSSLGVMPQQMITSSGSGNGGVTSLESWGSNLSLVGGMEVMRIDIVVSEFRKSSDSAKKPRGPKNSGKGGKGQDSKFLLEIPSEAPAFLCERVSIECDLRRAADMTVVEDLSRQRRNMLYVSRGQLKKNSNTAVNVCVSVRYISQQVNMPLLRLLHQISNMYQNVKDTQSELKEQLPGETKLLPKTTVNNNGGLESHNISMQTLVPTETDRFMSRPITSFYRSPSESKPIVSPSASVRSRPTSLAQKLRSTSKSVRGYMNLSDNNVGHLQNGSFPSPVPSVSDGRISPTKSKDHDITPRCWKTIYYLLDLYATMPETKTVDHRISMAGDLADSFKVVKKFETLIEAKSSEDIEKGEGVPNMTPSLPPPLPPPPQSMVRGERTRLIVFAVARIHRTRLQATLSGLKLDAEITSLHSSITCRKKTRPPSLECSVTGQVGRAMVVLLEGVAPSQQTVVKATVGKSQALYSSMSRRTKDKNSGLLTIGAVNIDIPQHPVALHGMMTRGSKQLSSTLQELRVTRTSNRMSRGAPIDETDAGPSNTGQYSPEFRASENEPTVPKPQLPLEPTTILQPLVMHFTGVVQSLSITAALLPSLQAQYKMDQVTSTGVTGSKAKFIIDLPRHSLSFSTKVQITETNLPSEASIELPKVHVSAEYVQQDTNKQSEAQFAGTTGVVLRQGNYLNAVADIGVFEHSLTTDLLNHLVFVQKVFMKEVNEVVQKVYGGEKPVPIWLEDSETTDSNPSSKRILLFSLVVQVKRVQLTATTPSNCAVRLESGLAECQLSNRVQNISGADAAVARLFVKAHVDVNVSLGQVIRNALFEEADPEFQHFAFFKTRISLRNAVQGEMGGDGEDKEVILITMRRPLIYIQPVAVDKAILVWLNYKNAYEYWNEQRASLNKEVLTATQQVFEKVQFEKFAAGPHLGTLFLQLTVEDMGICVPLNPLPPCPRQATWSLNRSLFVDSDSCAAVVITLESTIISACSSGSLVSKGRFVGLCLRFADDFETSLDDWKPDPLSTETVMNLCTVSEGTYEVCSRTITQKENAKWLLNVQWKMEGVDIDLDVNLGKQLSALGHTLTMLTGVQEDDTLTTGCDSDDADDTTIISQESILLRAGRNRLGSDTLSSLALDPSVDPKKRSKLLEKEMYEQAKVINDLRSLGASHGTIEQEMKRLHELETLVFKGFRRDMISKLRRQSIRGKSQIKGKLGIGKKGTTFRSKSFIAPSPMSEQQLDSCSPLLESMEDAVERSAFLGPSRSSSLRTARGQDGPRVTFRDSLSSITRQTSLPNASSELSLPVGGEFLDWEHPISSDSTDNSHSALLDSSPLKGPILLHTPLPSMSGNQKTQEPNIDFELDVKVLINSGKCALYTKDRAREDELKLISKMKKERSCSGGMFEFPPGSPNMSRRSNKENSRSANTSSSRLRTHLSAAPVNLLDVTIFHIPGLDVKVHYESKMITDESPPPKYSVDNNGVVTRKSGTKKASLFAWTTLQSIPEETIISPHILEFLEQTLAPIPQMNTSPFPSAGQMNNMFNLDTDDDVTNYVGQYAYASFPVDVIVYFHMKPSAFRFSCLPVSRVECMLQLPSLDIVFSSKRADSPNEDDFKTGMSNTAVGGLSVTGCLADFSLYIFHPYGGKKTSLKETQWSPLTDSERKDSLSVNVEFVKFHLSRSRKLNFEMTNSSQSHATIRFSTIIDIGSASFKYDMRRLTEILAFPKAWYRRSIFRRMFLGDMTSGEGTMYSEEDSSPENSPNSRRWHSPDGLMFASSKNSGKGSKNAQNRAKMRLNFDADTKNQHHNFQDEGSSSGSSFSPELKTSGKTAWETLVLFAVNFKRLNVHMNMGNVMGNVMWLTKEFRSEGRLSIGSTGHKNMFISLGLSGSSLDAKMGIVGGTIELSKVDTYVHIREDAEVEPDHTVGLRLATLELRFDYMGTGVLMTRVSSLNVSLRDEWKLFASDKFNPTKRPAQIFMHGDLGWDQLQIMISKSTTTDLMKMYYKLEEFFSQQFKSSKRVFSNLQTDPRVRPNTLSYSKRTSGKKKPVHIAPDNLTPFWARHHRHWQPVLKVAAGLNLSTSRHPLPEWGSLLGGTMDLHGNNISLACFHGINFKSKSWALFSLKEPCISFSTEAQEVSSSGCDTKESLDVHVVETLTFSLGMAPGQHYAQTHHSMATVCRVSRNQIFPPQFRTLHEWFHYAFAVSDIDAVDRFPVSEREKTDSSGETIRSRTPKSQDPPNHTREVIFALPSLQLHLETNHLQAAMTPDVSGVKPTVECSFITEFEDHIFVTVDAEAFFFLHDLITSYIRENDRVASSGSGPAHSPDLSDRSGKSQGGEPVTSTPKDRLKKQQSADHSGDIFTKDWRNFNCKTWHLEPTVRLLSWGGKSIEPYGVDYILQKLGFAHARTTIPKWMQRGFLDPLDKVLAVLVLRMVMLVREETKKHLKSTRD
nr:PREDICTED: uncharacterized protein KIAA1109 isoform X3 [Bemisia tabaci]